MQSPLRTISRRHAADWGVRPVVLDHGLDRDAALDRQAVAELIQRCPDGHYRLFRRGEAPSGAVSEGEIGDLTGHEVIDWIGAGRLCLVLDDVAAMDRRIADMAALVRDRLALDLPQASDVAPAVDLVIASPGMALPYSLSAGSLSLWQVSGDATLHLYPSTPPFATARDRMRARTGDRVEPSFDPAFDRSALTLDLPAGRMAVVPAGTPHRLVTGSRTSVHLVMAHRNARPSGAGNDTSSAKAVRSPPLPAGVLSLVKVALTMLGGTRCESGAARRPAFRLARKAPGSLVDLA